jgi:hypothetical protein
VVFLEKTGKRVEKILGKLTFVGIGKRPKSSVRYCMKKFQEKCISTRKKYDPFSSHS